MKLSVINKEREPESVAPKIKVFESEKDLNEALPDLKDGAIVATKEGESSYGQPVEAVLKIIIEDGATVNQNITLYPTGNGLYTFGATVSFSTRSWKQPYQLFDYSVEGFDFVNLNMSVTQYNIGPLPASTVISAKRGYATITDTSETIVMNVSGILKRS